MKDYTIGMSLHDLYMMGRFRSGAVSIFIKKSMEDEHGEFFMEDFGLGSILSAKPEIASYKVCSSNPYIGSTVLRVINPEKYQ